MGLRSEKAAAAVLAADMCKRLEARNRSKAVPLLGGWPCAARRARVRRANRALLRTDSGHAPYTPPAHQKRVTDRSCESDVSQRRRHRCIRLYVMYYPVRGSAGVARGRTTHPRQVPYTGRETGTADARFRRERAFRVYSEKRARGIHKPEHAPARGQSL